MPGTEELLARLQQLEDGYYGDKEAARQKSFFDTYGSRFSNNRGLGLAILNELDARGIDTSAADEAVGQILDTLRTECNEIIESIKEVQQDAIENAQKVEAINDVVSQAVAANPEASATVASPSLDLEGMGTMPEQLPEQLPDTGEPMPEGMPDQLPETGETEPMPEGMPEPMPEQLPETGETEPMPENTELSDVREKRIKRMKGAWGKARGQKKTKDENAYKPSSGILSACGGTVC